MCAILGLVTDKDNASLTMYNALTVLQHRGQDAAGMATVQDGNNLNIHKDNGLVRDVFSEDSMMALKGNLTLNNQTFGDTLPGITFKKITGALPTALAGHLIRDNNGDLYYGTE